MARFHAISANFGITTVTSVQALVCLAGAAVSAGGVVLPAEAAEFARTKDEAQSLEPAAEFEGP